MFDDRALWLVLDCKEKAAVDSSHSPLKLVVSTPELLSVLIFSHSDHPTLPIQIVTSLETTVPYKAAFSLWPV